MVTGTDKNIVCLETNTHTHTHTHVPVLFITSVHILTCILNVVSARFRLTFFYLLLIFSVKILKE